jgi:hypothetical protein
MVEIWKTHDEFKDYELSNLGNVRNKFTKEEVKLYVNAKKNGYISVRLYLNGKILIIGREILKLFVRHPKEKEECDHINRNPLDNRLINLRWVDSAQNNLNKKTYGNSKYRGVSKCHTTYKTKDGLIKKSFQIIAQITVNKKRIKLGSFKTEQEAHEAYKVAFKKYRGYDWLD